MVLGGPSWLCCTQNLAPGNGPLLARPAGKPRSSISLTLEDSGASSPCANTTFCCKFASFPEGSWEACGSLPPSSDPGLSAPPTPVPILRADLAGILGVSGVLLFGCGYLLHLLRRQKHRPTPRLQPSHTNSQALTARAWAPSQASQAALHDPYVHYQHQLLPSYFGHGSPQRVGIAPHPRRTPAPGPCRLGLHTHPCTWQLCLC
ncbi:hypothetical protein H8959_008293 [Pygathrix nigripes]